MGAGEYRNRIILQKPVQAVSDFGETEISYEDVATVPAAIEWESGRRFESAKQLNAEVQGVIRIRHRSDVKPDWRIQYGGRYISILTIANLRERDVELQLNCKEAQD